MKKEKKTLLIVTMVQALVVAASMAWGADKGAGVASTAGMPIMVILLMVLGAAFYFLPAIIGFSRKKDNKISL